MWTSGVACASVPLPTRDQLRPRRVHRLGAGCLPGIGPDNLNDMQQQPCVQLQEPDPDLGGQPGQVEITKVEP